MATQNWSINSLTRSIRIATVTLAGGDTSDDLDIADFQDKTVHIFGTFGSSTVSVKGLNDATANAQNIHRTDDPTTTYTTVAAELLGHMLENPRFIRASASAGTGTGLKVVIAAVTPRG